MVGSVSGSPLAAAAASGAPVHPLSTLPAEVARTLPAEQLAGRIQHALLGQGVTERAVRDHVQDAVRYGFDAAVVSPAWVAAARDELRGTAVRIGSVVDYPHGNGTSVGRAAEARALVDLGVDELDCTVNVGLLLSSRVPEFAADLRRVVEAAAPIGVKFMLELPLQDERRRDQAVRAAVEAGAAFVEPASRGLVGFADPATTAYLRRSVPASVGVKASGGVRTVEQVRALLAAGADLIGTSAGVAIVTGARSAEASLYSY
jgi:deoxyribose-phosphate aldolase